MSAFAGPGGVADGPGWSGWLWTRVTSGANTETISGLKAALLASVPLLFIMLGGGFLAGQHNLGWTLPTLPVSWVWLALGAEALLLLARGVDRGRAALPGLPTGTVTWEPGGELRVADAFGGGGDAVAAADVAAVVWTPVRWYGWWSRVPLALGASLHIQRVSGPPVAIARGLDPQGLRNLAERLARDLGAPMVEALPIVIRREVAQLDRPLVRGRIRATSAFRASHSSWVHGPTAGGGWRATLSARRHVETFVAIAFSAENLLLPPLLAFEAFRLYMTVALLGPSNVALHFLSKPALELVLYTLVIGDYARQVRDVSRVQVVEIAGGKLRATRASEALGWLPVLRIEQVRAEAFPTPSVRVIADGRELLIAELPTQLDAEALAELLPAALAAHVAPHDGEGASQG